MEVELALEKKIIQLIWVSTIKSFWYLESGYWEYKYYKLKTLELVKRVNLVLGWYKRTRWRALYKIVYLIY